MLKVLYGTLWHREAPLCFKSVIDVKAQNVCFVKLVKCWFCTNPYRQSQYIYIKYTLTGHFIR